MIVARSGEKAAFFREAILFHVNEELIDLTSFVLRCKLNIGRPKRTEQVLCWIVYPSSVQSERMRGGLRIGQFFNVINKEGTMKRCYQLLRCLGFIGLCSVGGMTTPAISGEAKSPAEGYNIHVQAPQAHLLR